MKKLYIFIIVLFVGFLYNNVLYAFTINKVYKNIISTAEIPDNFEKFDVLWDVSSINFDQLGSSQKSNALNKLSNESPKSQPTFVDVAILQLRTVQNLEESLKYFDISDIKVLFQNNDSYSNYLRWENKFTWYENREEFVNAFTGYVNLKDIWIWTDIINWLSCKLLNELNSSDCSFQKITVKSYDNKLDFYSLKYIIENISEIIDNYVSIYEILEKINDESNNIWDENTRNYLSNYLSKIFDEWENIDWDREKIWDYLTARINNLQTIILNIDEQDMNLRWLYNIYLQINQASIWIKKVSSIYKPMIQWNEKKLREWISQNLKSEMRELFDNSHSDDLLEEFVLKYFESRLFLEKNSSNPVIEEFAIAELQNNWSFVYDDNDWYINLWDWSSNDLWISSIVLENTYEYFEKFKKWEKVILCPDYGVITTDTWNNWLEWKFTDSCKYDDTISEWYWKLLGRWYDREWLENLINYKNPWKSYEQTFEKFHKSACNNNENVDENYDPYGLNLWWCERYTEQNIDWQGQEYNAVEIWWQIWFTENLNYDYWDSVCFWYNEENCDSYWRLYSKDDVQEDDVQGSYLCPDWWRVPSDDDWKVLEIYLSWIDEIASELDTDHSFFSENFDRLSSYDIKNKLTNQLNFNFWWIFSPHSSGTRRGPSTSWRYRASDLWQRWIDHDKLWLRRSYVDSDIARYSVRCMKDNENEDEDDEDEDETCWEDWTSAFDCTNMNNENSCKNWARKECCEWTGSMCISK